MERANVLVYGTARTKEVPSDLNSEGREDVWETPTQSSQGKNAPAHFHRYCHQGKPNKNVTHTLRTFEWQGNVICNSF